jgi:hypothetical protein
MPGCVETLHGAGEGHFGGAGPALLNVKLMKLRNERQTEALGVEAMRVHVAFDEFR